MHCKPVTSYTIIFFIFKILNTIIINATTPPINCRALTSSPLSYQVYTLEKTNPLDEFSYSQFIENCAKHPNSISSSSSSSSSSNNNNNKTKEFKDYIYTHRNTFNSQLSSNETHLNFFIFDFRIIQNDVIYIDFLNYDKYLDRKSTNNSNCKQSNLILYFVTQQFTIFKLLNVPDIKHECLTKITILIHGRSHLNIVDKTNSEYSIPIEVIHSPLYFNFERVEEGIIEESNRLEWIEYLKKIFNTENFLFVENLFVFCHIFHIEIDLNYLLDYSFATKDYTYVNYMTQMKLNLNEADSANLNQRCEINLSVLNDYNDNDKNLNDARVLIKPENLYLFELNGGDHRNDSQSTNKIIYIFIKECSKVENYFLILYSNKIENKIVLEDSNCNLQIYVSSFSFYKKFLHLS